MNSSLAMLNTFLSGAIFSALLFVALSFLRFWQRTRDELFLYFAAAFATLAVERIILVSTPPEAEFAPYIYLVRLAAYGLIIAGIVQKNRDK